MPQKPLSQDLSKAVRQIEDYLTKIPQLEQECRSLQAKKQQLSSSIEALTVRHSSIHDDIAVERQRRIEESNKAVDTVLERKLELEKSNKALEKQHHDLGIEIAESEQRSKAIEDTFKNTEQSLAVLERTKSALTKDLSTLKTELAEVQSLIEAGRVQTADITNSIASKLTELEASKELIEQSKHELDDLQADYVTRKNKLDDELRSILLNIQDKVIQYKQICEKEEGVRKGLAEERIRLDNERAAMEKQKSRLSESEGRIAKQRAYMKL